MKNITDIFDDVFIAEAKQDTLNLIYNIDVALTGVPTNKDIAKEKAAQPATEPATTPTPDAAVPATVPAATEQPVEAAFEQLKNVINEATKMVKKEGVLAVPKESSENIQTVSDLLDYLKDHGGIDKVVMELITNLVIDPGNEEAMALIGKNDKIIAEVSYGTKKADSIGFKVNKNAGVGDISIMMLKDGELLDAKFDKDLVNKQILYYRNYVVSEK